MKNNLKKFMLTLFVLHFCNTRMQFTISCEACKTENCGNKRCVFVRSHDFISQICMPDYDCSQSQANPAQYYFGRCQYDLQANPCRSKVCMFLGKEGCINQYLNISSGETELFYVQYCGSCSRTNCGTCLKHQQHRTYYENCLKQLTCNGLSVDLTLQLKKCEKDVNGNECNLCYSLESPKPSQLNTGTCIQQGHFLHKSKNFLQYVLNPSKKKRDIIQMQRSPIFC